MLIFMSPYEARLSVEAALFTDIKVTEDFSILAEHGGSS